MINTPRPKLISLLKYIWINRLTQQCGAHEVHYHLINTSLDSQVILSGISQKYFNDSSNLIKVKAAEKTKLNFIDQTGEKVF